MRKIYFAFICSFILFGWMGCEKKKKKNLRLSRNKTADGSDSSNQCEFPYLNFQKFFAVEVDSAASCCGIDSFAIKSPWMQERINTFLADSARLKEELYTSLQFDYFTDSLGTDYILENKFILRNCEGTLLVDFEDNDSIINAIYYNDHLPIYTLAFIEIGLIPNI